MQHKERKKRGRERETEEVGWEKKITKKKRRNASRFLSLDVLLKFVRHLSPPFPSLMIPAEPLWGMASVARLAFTFPRHQVFWDTESGDSEAHHSRSSSGSFSLLSNRLHTIFFLSFFLPFCCCTFAYSDNLCLTLVFCLSSSLSLFLLLFFDLRRMISSVEKKKMHAQERRGGSFY